MANKLFTTYTPGKTVNRAGSEVYRVSPEQAFRRFLILGTDAGYYANSKEKTIEAADAAVQLLERDPKAYFHILHEVSTGGLALKEQPNLFALSLALSDPREVVRSEAMKMFPQIARTSTHLFTLLNYLKGKRGLGSYGMKRTLSGWYLDRPASWVTYQTTKYRQREGWTHRDVLRFARPKLGPEYPNAEMESVIHWIATGKVNDDAPDKLIAYIDAQKPGADLVSLIERYGLTREMIPTDALNDPKVWVALSKRMLPTALMRNLPTLTRHGLADHPTVMEQVIRLRDPEVLKAGRIHPVQILLASKTYASGKGKGHTWTPNTFIMNVLNDAFYAAYGAVKSSGKRELYAVDVSGSMKVPISEDSNLTAREAAVALALVAKATSPDLVDVVAFSAEMPGAWHSGKYVRYGYGHTSELGLAPLDITPKRRLDDMVKSVTGLPFGGTDCSLPMIWARETGKEYDAFVVITDNETWAHVQNPADALRSYRKASGIADAKLVVAGMESSRGTIADPSDPGMLDVVGLDPSVPTLISEFIGGRV